MLTDTKYIKFYKSLYSEELIKKAREIELLAFDVDGVLTDGGLYFDQNGNEATKHCTVYRTFSSEVPLQMIPKVIL